MEGFYAIYYTGRFGSGFGVLVLKEGIITGADAAGGFYDGEYSTDEGTKNLKGTIKMTVPPGVPLVTGIPAGQQSYTLEFPISAPLDSIEQKLLRVETPTGPVNVNLKKIRDFPG